MGILTASASDLAQQVRVLAVYKNLGRRWTFVRLSRNPATEARQEYSGAYCG